ncbi:MAG: deoxyribonuclease V [Planctomycetes bacterium]|nr:deoxyribonuclease V [Planctomycetota bacterium]
MTDVWDLHEWDLTPLQARQLQEKLKGQITLRSLQKKPRFVAGLDCSLDKRRGLIFAAAVIFSFPELKLVETATAQMPLVFPYVPGLLSFREMPVCLEAVRKVQTLVDLWLIDGQGIAHPRRLGLASHLGLFLNTPTIGCAKSRLIGTYDEPGKNKGEFSWLYDKDEKIGAVVRTRDNVKPLFISPGHLCSFEDAVKYALACTIKYRLPEPTRLAHQTVSKVKTVNERK